MSQATVDRLITEIGKLSDQDRELLNQRLAALDEARWQAEATEARKAAEADGIDQEHIDRTIEKMRYG